MRRQACIGGFLILCFLESYAPTSCWAQKNNRDQQDEKRENQRVAQAEKAWQQSKKELAEIQKQVREKIQQVQASAQKIQQSKTLLREARDQVEDRLGESLGIRQALEQVNAAQKSLDIVSAPVVLQLQSTEAWKQAKLSADAANAEKDKVLEDTELEEDSRFDQIQLLTSTAQKPKEMERAAIQADPECQRRLEKVKVSLESLEKIRRSISDEKVNADPEVVKANQNLTKAQGTERDLEKQLATVRAKGLQVQKQVHSAYQNLAKARAADAADPNRPKKKR